MSWMVPLEWKGEHGCFGRRNSRLHRHEPLLAPLAGHRVMFRPDIASYGNAIPAMLHAMVRAKPAPMRQPDILPIDELNGVRASSMP